MTADSDSHIAWQRAQLKKLRAALKAIEADQLGKANCGRATQMTIDELQRKIGESGALHRRVRAPHPSSAGDGPRQPCQRQLDALERQYADGQGAAPPRMRA
ncbi:hypothetical protein ABIF38_001334 [Bradyrhizobium japonicum]|uniref:hypothetical protein n=1 Tax=Bradyrhizobium elkanii TaxID=29448 RepID=UPI003470ECC8